MNAIIHYLKSGDGHSWLGFWCPGCQRAHAIPFINAPPPAPPGLWCYDGNPISPTISPSLNVMTGDGKETFCHIVVTAGVLNYVGGKHALSGKSVPMQPWDRDDES